MAIFKNLVKRDVSEIPKHKRIQQITVDCFDIPVEGCTHYFLSHFHSDHYTRLCKSFEHSVYCSKTTANLVSLHLGAKVIGLDMYMTYNMGTFFVRLVEANHCPGAFLFIFLIGNEYFLHTGDFRFHQKFHKLNLDFKSIYLDNTYEGFIDFPTQEEVISEILKVFDQSNLLCPMNICVLCCTYCVGKEKVFLSIGEYLNKSIQVTEDKLAIYQCYDEYTVDRLNSEVLEIVREKRLKEKTYGFVKKLEFKTEIRTMEKKLRSTNIIQVKDMPKLKISRNDEFIERLDSIKIHKNTLFEDISNCQSNYKKSKTLPFDRLTLGESQIKVISMAELQTFDTSKIFADKIYILCGTGWREKHQFKNYKRMDGKVIKRGIEIIHFRYSEHSTSKELNEFQLINRFENVINTVNNKD